MAKQRLDVLLVERGLADSRTKAQALIMAGQVSGPDRILDKPGQLVASDLSVHVKQQARYASRAGDKLASVAAELGLDFRRLSVLDVGSSTGGFTDFALQNGAEHVYCVDVGSAQLAYKLREDPRVTVMERTDIRDAVLPAPADIAVIDVSFISLQQVMPAVSALLKPGALIVAMAKPQFEAGKELADRYHGVLPLGEERDMVLQELRDHLQATYEIICEADSAVAGMHGNVERFFVLRLRG